MPKKVRVAKEVLLDCKHFFPLIYRRIEDTLHTERPVNATTFIDFLNTSHDQSTFHAMLDAN